MIKYTKAMTSESQRRRAMTMKRRALEDGEPPRDCFDIMQLGYDEAESDERMEYDNYISDGENND